MKSYILAVGAVLSVAANGAVLRRANLPCGATQSTNYTVVENDTLSKISAKYGAGICDIAKANDISNPDVIEVGEVLIIPTNCQTIDNTTCIKSTPPVNDTCVLGFPASYVVASGDTLSAIATNFEISLDALEKDNPQISNFDAIAVGQLIYVPVCPNSSCTIAPYTIVSGDIFYNLAQKYNSTVGQIESANPGVDPTKLAIDQVISLPQNCAQN